MNNLRRIPSVDSLLGHPRAVDWCARHGRPMVVEGLRQAADELRSTSPFPPAGSETEWVMDRLAGWLEYRLQRLVNATGVVLHTNLGRAPLARQALERVVETCSGYCNLEFSLETGGRGKRDNLVKSYLTRLTGAEDALVVNNCAAAMVLILDTLARGKEVIVSRGELIEIGGSFRIPDILARAGARLVEVGTTNKTRLSDYSSALSDQTGLLLSTHSSNFKVVGFTESVSPAALTALGRERNIPTCLDLGSGLMETFWPDEPTVPGCLDFDLVAFSGDKLLGGPQAGIVVGRAAWIKRLAVNPLMRALRVDKLVYAALEGTLRAHLGALENLPVWAMLKAEPQVLRQRAQRLAERLEPVLGESAAVTVVEGGSSVGGGSLPGQELPTWLVEVRPRACSEDRLLDDLRRARPPVVARRARGAVLLDPRTLLDGDEDHIEEAFRWLTTL
ncbi:MAG: L-seryl-tRNA(Sec) selenium transferase [Candidatus Eremiobacteraeota bacterium]|nr:L-seryl-tRNA(Sec) selenium transferase [Candidatus Eremiobacteraeota bacterium]